MTFRTPSGLRWTCRSCATCCTAGYDLGPVEQPVVDGLVAAGIESLWPAAAAGWLETRRAPDGRAFHFLAHRDGACVFLRDDGLCAVHALLGPQAKPGFCREFPYHLVEEPRGVVAIVRPDCGGFHRSFRDGDAVGPELDEVAALPRVEPRRRFAPERVPVLPGAEIDLNTWLGWEDAVVAALEAAPELGPGPAVALVRDALYGRAGTQAPPVGEGRATMAAQAVLLGLEQVMKAVLAQPGGPPERVAFARDAAERLGRARASVSVPVRDTTAELDAYVHLLLRSHLVAKQWAAWGSVADGVGHFLLGVVVAIAQAPGPGPVDPEGFQDAYRHWLRFSHNQLITAVLRKARPALLDLFLHAR